MSDQWPTTKAAGVACVACGKLGTCNVSPDRQRFKCWRDGGKIHQLNGNGHPGGNGTGYVGQAHRKGGSAKGAAGRAAGGPTKVYPTADATIDATGRTMQGAVLVAVYAYHHADGTDAFRVARFDLPTGDKSFRPVCPCKGGWKVGDPPGQLPPYRLRDHLTGTGTVFVTEGERACDAAWSIGLPATTSAHGSAAAGKSDWSPLAGRDVVILPDNDDPGRKYARTVAKILVKLDPPGRVRMLHFAGLPDGGDVVEFIAARADLDPAEIGAEVEQLADAAAVVPPVDLVGGLKWETHADITPVEIDWLWPGRFPLDRMSLLVGAPGAGKSFLTCDMAAHVSTGMPWPDGRPCPTGDVVFITAEDDPADTIRPRLDACGADVRRVHQVRCVRRVDDETGEPRDEMFTLADVAELAGMLKQLPDVRLIVIDPIGSFLGGGVDSHRDNEVRAVLDPIGMLAARFNAAVVVVAHRRKGSAGSADETAMGSTAFTGIVRAVWHLSRDPDNRKRRLLLPGKGNLADDAAGGLAFGLVGDPTAAVVWEREPVNMTADDGMHAQRAAETNGPAEPAKPGPQPAAKSEAADWLAAELADLAEHKVGDIRAAAGEAGLAWRTVQRARESLGVLVEKGAFHGGYIWRLPKLGTAAGVEPIDPAADATPADACPFLDDGDDTTARVRVVHNGGTGTELRDALADLLDPAASPARAREDT